MRTIEGEWLKDTRYFPKQNFWLHMVTTETELEELVHSIFSEIAAEKERAQLEAGERASDAFLRNYDV